MIIAYDLGTGGLKASIHNEEGLILESAFEPYKTYFKDMIYQEQMPDDWWNAVVLTTRQLVMKSGVEVSDITCLAISGHSLGTVPVDKDGNLLQDKTPIWSDMRAKKQARAFFGCYDFKKWYMTTGNGFPRDLYTVFKIKWLEENEPELFKKTYKFLGTKDYLNLKLTGQMLTDHSYASGSGVYNLRANAYDDEIILAVGLNRDVLPEIVSSAQVIGTLTKEAASALGLSVSTKVVSGGVDNSCMALGAGCFDEGSVYLSFGTSAWIALSSDEPVLDADKYPFVFAHCVPGQYTSAVSSFTAAGALNWAKERICADLSEQAEKRGKEIFELIEEHAANSPAGANKLIFNPNLLGGSAFEESPFIRGGFAGLVMSHTRDDMLRSVMEGVAMNLAVVFELLQSLTDVSDELLLVGGGSKSPLWRQIITDVFNTRTKKTTVDQNAASLGAASLALVGTGVWKDYSKIKELHSVTEFREPTPENVQKYEKIMPIFKEVSSFYARIGEQLESIEL